METADTAAEYSERRPRGQAWRVCQSGSVTYADSRDAALRSHKAKLAALAEAESLLRAAAVASNSGKWTGFLKHFEMIVRHKEKSAPHNNYEDADKEN